MKIERAYGRVAPRGPSLFGAADRIRTGDVQRGKLAEHFPGFSPPVLFAHFPKSSSNWLSEGGGLRFGPRMMPTDREDTVLATVESGETYPIRVVRRRLPRGTGQLSGIFTCSPGWAQARRLPRSALPRLRRSAIQGAGRYVRNFTRAFFADWRKHDELWLYEVL